MFDQLDESKYNIIFAHSQGNLFANTLCDINNNRKKQINISIATPASQTKCGNQYITAHKDVIINQLRRPTLRLSIKPPLKANWNMRWASLCSDLAMCHGLNEVYLYYPHSIKILKDYVQSNLKEISNKEQNFNLSISLTQYKKEDKNLAENSVDSLREISSDIGLSYRRKVASVKTLSYVSEVMNAGFIGSLVKLSFNKITKKDFQEFLDTEISVESDQEYADVIGLVFDNLKGYCLDNKKLLPRSIVNTCNQMKDCYYYQSLEYSNSTNFDKMKLSSNHFFWKESKLNLKCSEAQELVQNVYLSYQPSISNISSIKIENNRYDVYPRHLLNKKVEEEIVGRVAVKYTDQYKISYQAFSDKVNYIEKNKSSDEYKRCNSLSKLLANSCKSYLLNLLSQR